MEGLIEGRIVHYVDRADEEHYAAIVARVLNAQTGTVILAVFVPYLTPKYVECHFDANCGDLTWHWIERA